MKSNTKEPAGKDEFWIVDNQLTFNKMQVLADSLRFDRKYILIPELVPSTHYNVTTKEVYAVPIVEKNVYGLSAMRIGKREFIGWSHQK